MIGKEREGKELKDEGDQRMDQEKREQQRRYIRERNNNK